MDILLGVARVVAFVLGLWAVLGTVLSAIRTLVLPRGDRDFLTRVVFRLSRRCFDLVLRRAKTYLARDRILALYGPLTLMMLPIAWLLAVELGYTAMFWGVGVLSLQKAATLSGSSLLTLGFATADGMLQTALVFSEAAIGLILVALMIAYLPTIYSAFSKRELAVAMLEVRAGSPASAIELLERFNRLKNLERMRDLWLTWESWFAEIEENHTSLPVLSFFRSPQPDRSWVTAAGAVLDAASLSLAALDIPREGQAALCIRAGYVSLRRIADYFGIVRTVPEDTPDGIYIGRDEFDAALDRMVQAGIPIKADRDQAWKDFVGWRINYEAALLALCTMTMAPEAPWSSDRAPRRYDAPSM